MTVGLPEQIGSLRLPCIFETRTQLGTPTDLIILGEEL